MCYMQLNKAIMHVHRNVGKLIFVYTVYLNYKKNVWYLFMLLETGLLLLKRCLPVYIEIYMYLMNVKNVVRAVRCGIKH